MRTISETLESHFGQLETSYAFFLLIEPLRGVPEGYTSHDLSHTIDGVVYDAESGQVSTSIPARLQLDAEDGPDVIFIGGGNFDFQLLKLGYYEGAKFRIFAANYEGDLTDQATLMAGTIGQADPEDDRIATVQLNSLATPANKPHGFQTTPTCQAGRFGVKRCRNPISEGGLDDGPDIADYTTTAEVTAVESAQRFTLDIADVALTGWADIAVGETTSRFLGILRATSGANFNDDVDFGAEEVVKSFDSVTGEVVLRQPLPFAPIVGDTFECERGCDFAWTTCKMQPGSSGSNGNADNFYLGFPFILIDKVTKRREAS